MEISFSIIFIINREGAMKHVGIFFVALIFSFTTVYSKTELCSIAGLYTEDNQEILRLGSNYTNIYVDKVSGTFASSREKDCERLVHNSIITSILGPNKLIKAREFQLVLDNFVQFLKKDFEIKRLFQNSGESEWIKNQDKYCQVNTKPHKLFYYARISEVSGKNSRIIGAGREISPRLAGGYMEANALCVRVPR